MPSYKGFVSAEVAWALAECIKVLDGVGRSRRLTLRILYATPWNPWTLVETLDKKTGQRVKKALIAAPLICPHNPLVPG
jgi:hypothetical protein